MTVKETLQKARENVASVLEEITANPKPTYNVEGRSYSWTEYQKFLLEALDRLRLQIDNEDDDGIVEEITEAIN